MNRRSPSNNWRNCSGIVLALVLGSVVGWFWSRHLSPGRAGKPSDYDYELAALFKAKRVSDSRGTPGPRQFDDPRSVAEFQAEFERLSERLTPGAAYPLANHINAWLEQHPRSGLLALEKLVDAPSSFPLALLVQSCGERHGDLVLDRWRQNPKDFGARFALGLAAAMRGKDGVTASEAMFWSVVMPLGQDATVFHEIVHEAESLRVALTRCAAAGHLPECARDALNRALGHKYGKEVLSIDEAPDALLLGMLERVSQESLPEALTQATRHGDDDTLLERLMPLLWDQDDVALREAIASVEKRGLRKRLGKALFNEALNRIEPSEVLEVWEEVVRISGARRPLEEDEVREAAGNSPLFAFPVLASAFSERMWDRGPALDYGELCARQLGSALLRSDHLNPELKAGLRFSLHQGTFEDWVDSQSPDSDRAAARAVFVWDTARAEPGRALALAASIEDPVIRNRAYMGMVSGPNTALVPDIAKQAIDSIDDSKMRASTIERWAYWLGTHSPHQGSQILAEMHSKEALPDKAIARFIETSAEADIEGAMAWLYELESDALRDETTQLLKRWHRIR